MDQIRSQMRDKAYTCDKDVLENLAALAPSPEARAEISHQASAMVKRLRAEAKPSMMELFLAEYGLSSEEGIALMCLAEALLRVPDAATMDALIEDKIAPSEWHQAIKLETALIGLAQQLKSCIHISQSPCRI